MSLEDLSEGGRRKRVKRPTFKERKSEGKLKRAAALGLTIHPQQIMIALRV
jgi:hypothetical protein